MRWVRLGLFVCGAALFLWLLATIGIFGSVAQYLFTRGCQIGQASA